MRIDEIKTQLKLDYPTLRNGSEEDGYTEIVGNEYEKIIAQWAEDVYAQELRAQAKAEAEAQRQALLEKLGITEEEARLLLGGN